jgi:biopolymer transport protein TolR
MAFDDLGSDSSTISQINVTPLVDVMLVLLIIFMVAAPILQQGVQLELPKESLAPLEGDAEQLVVSIDRTGKVFIGEGNEVAVQNLGERVSGILARKADKRVFIKADRTVQYGNVMAAMASLKRSGVEKVGLVTDPSDPATVKSKKKA